jgi:DNA repair protein RadC
MELFIQDPSGNYLPAPDKVIFNAARTAMARKLKRGVNFSSPAIAKKMLPELLGSMEREVFAAAFLDTRHRLIEFRELFYGTIDGASVHPRELVKVALELNAQAVVIVHNHPSGEPEASNADELLTQRVKEGLALVDIRLLDHFIVAGECINSLAERGII